jgi:hypothetical protein
MRGMNSFFLKLIFGIASFVLFLSPQTFSAVPSGGAAQGLSAIEHTPIVSFSHGDKLKIEATAKMGADCMIFYFRYSGVAQWQARNMVKSSLSSYAFEFETSVLPSNEFEYYLEAQRAGQKFYYPSSAPGQPLKVSGASTEPLPQVPENMPTPQEEEKKFELPFAGNGSLQSAIYEKAPQPGSKSTTAGGNFRVFHTGKVLGSTGINVDSNFSFTNTPLPAEKNVDLSNMIVGVTQGSHTLQAGDISLNESEYSVNGAGRRGVDYVFNNQTVYVHAFDISSQQVKGFKGFGIPNEEVSVMGGAAGLNLFQNAVSVKAIYVGGKDNPFKGTNVGASPNSAARQGHVLAVTEETRLFNNCWNLKVEFARSKYDADLSDQKRESSDNALCLGTGFSLGPLTLGAIYRYIGKNFNSVGLQSLANDKKGLETSLSFSKGILNIQGSFMLQQDNVKNDPSQATTKADNGSINCSLSFSPKLMFGLGYRRTGQRTTPGGAETVNQDSLTDEFSGTLNFNLSSAASLNVTVTNSNLSSRANPTTDGSALGLNLGCLINVADVLTLSPTFGVSQSLNKSTNKKILTYNSLLAGEVYLVRRLCSVLIAGSFNRSEAPAAGATSGLDITSGLNFYLGRALKFTELVLSAKGNYRLNESSGLKTENYRIFFQSDISF